jgi:hypothetical protein
MFSVTDKGVEVALATVDLQLVATNAKRVSPNKIIFFMFVKF